MNIATPWIVYIIECADQSLYTGITTNLARRMQAHESGKGAKYTRGRAPLRVIYTETCANRSEASGREWVIKQLDKAGKLRLAAIMA